MWEAWGNCVLPRIRVTMPVPQPMSRTVWGLETGAWTTRLSAKATRERCWSWRRECSAGLVVENELAGIQVEAIMNHWVGRRKRADLTTCLE